MKKLCAVFFLSHLSLMATLPTTAAPSVKTWKPDYSQQSYDQNRYYNMTDDEEEESNESIKPGDVSESKTLTEETFQDSKWQK